MKRDTSIPERFAYVVHATTAQKRLLLRLADRVRAGDRGGLCASPVGLHRGSRKRLALVTANEWTPQGAAVLELTPDGRDLVTWLASMSCDTAARTIEL